MLRHLIKKRFQPVSKNCPLCLESYFENKEVATQRVCLKTILEFGSVAKAEQENACINCAIKLSNQIVYEKVDTQKIHQTRPAFAKRYEDLHHNKFLIEGIDYKIDEKGRWVLSRWHLLKREKCCGSACRNCPFGHSNVKKR